MANIQLTSPMSPTPSRLSKDLAARVLDRAARIDATEEKIDVDTLRAAAFDAGISPDAFERALYETSVPVLDTPLPTAGPRPNAYEIAVKTFWVGAISGAIVVAGAMLIFGPDEDALAGAAVGAGGVLAGVFIHLLRVFRKRKR
jgi:hypothetical protein